MSSTANAAVKNSTGLESYITKDFLETALGEKIENFKVTVGSNVGDNFTSVLYAVHVLIKGDTKSKHLLIKTYPILEARQKFLNETNLFSKEIKVYDEFLRDLVKFQKEGGKDESLIIHPSVPQFICGKALDYFQDDVDGNAYSSPLQNYLIMADIRPLGYKMTEKTKGLDFNHCALAVKALAEIHALGLALKKTWRIDSLVSQYPYLKDLCFNNNGQIVGYMINKNFQLVVDMVKEKFGENSTTMKFIEKIQKIGPSKVLSSFIPHSGKIDEKEVCSYLLKNEEDELGIEHGYIQCDSFTSSCHGDSWLNNMLFRYSADEVPTDIIMVDLQMYREGCISTDLSYMFYTSTTYEFRKMHLESLLRLYYETFLSFCTTLGVEPFDGFTFENLKLRFKRAKLFGLVSAALIVPVILSEEALDLDKVEVNTAGVQEEATFSDLFKSLTHDSSKNTKVIEYLLGIVNELIEDNVL